LELLQGVLPNNTPVAVKQLLMPSKVATPKQVFILDEFLNEMVLISGMRHRNLIKLRGCCVRGKERFLVYDFADNHDLDWVLLGQTLTQTSFMLNFSGSFLVPHANCVIVLDNLVISFCDSFAEGKGGHVSWPKRMNICLGVAHGLHYLHSLADPKIIHRDIKASNILLDKNLDPKIADFGFALLFPEEQSYIVTEHVAGTRSDTSVCFGWFRNWSRM
jgi:serine/threonine protein kinase